MSQPKSVVMAVREKASNLMFEYDLGGSLEVLAEASVLYGIYIALGGKKVMAFGENCKSLILISQVTAESYIAAKNSMSITKTVECLNRRFNKYIKAVYFDSIKLKNGFCSVQLYNRYSSKCIWGVQVLEKSRISGFVLNTFEALVREFTALDMQYKPYMFKTNGLSASQSLAGLFREVMRGIDNSDRH